MPETATAQVITITRILDAPRELVWKAWTEPEQLACWWGRAAGARHPSASRWTSGPAAASA